MNLPPEKAALVKAKSIRAALQEINPEVADFICNQILEHEQVKVENTKIYDEVDADDTSDEEEPDEAMFRPSGAVADFWAGDSQHKLSARYARALRDEYDEELDQDSRTRNIRSAITETVSSFDDSSILDSTLMDGGAYAGNAQGNAPAADDHFEAELKQITEVFDYDEALADAVIDEVDEPEAVAVVPPKRRRSNRDHGAEGEPALKRNRRSRTKRPAKEVAAQATAAAKAEAEAEANAVAEAQAKAPQERAERAERAERRARNRQGHSDFDPQALSDSLSQAVSQFQDQKRD